MATKYELLYIIPGKFTDAEVDSIVEEVKGVITDAGAEVAETHNVGKRKLAYPIKHVRHGTYILVFFNADTQVIKKMDETLRLTTNVLRHLVVERDPNVTEIPSFIEKEEWKPGRDRDAAPRRPSRPTPPPTQAPPAPESDKVSLEELDKKIEEILTEEVK